MSRRPRRVVPAVLAGVALLALGVYAATVALGHASGADPTGTLGPLSERLSATTWQDPGVVAAGVVLALLGLVAVLAALLPGRKVVLALDATDSGEAGITRDGLRRVLQDAAEHVDGVAAADADVREGRATVRVRSYLWDVADLRGRVEAAVTDRLDEVPLARRPRVLVRATTTRSDS